MRKLEFYEFVGVVAPGALLLFGLANIFQDVNSLLHDKQITFGELGLFLILAYIAGHLVQGIGNGVERVWWACSGGWPTDWVRTGKHQILAPAQLKILPLRVQENLRISCPDQLSDLGKSEWWNITRQAYAAVKKAGMSGRVDTFNGNYGMFRGIAASLVVLLCVALAELESHNYRMYGVLAVAAGLALLRMHRFGVHYARELFVQFLNLVPGESKAMKKEAADEL